MLLAGAVRCSLCQAGTYWSGSGEGASYLVAPTMMRCGPITIARDSDPLPLVPLLLPAGAAFMFRSDSRQTLVLSQSGERAVEAGNSRPGGRLAQSSIVSCFLMKHASDSS